MEKKILTREEQALDWLKSEIKKDKLHLEANKQKLVNSIKTLQKEEVVIPQKKLTLWQKIKKTLL
jgi:thiazole synthase ThiGH ThiG subunit